jgi:hypothetical protein
VVTQFALPRAGVVDLVAAPLRTGIRPTENPVGANGEDSVFAGVFDSSRVVFHRLGGTAASGAALADKGDVDVRDGDERPRRRGSDRSYSEA